MRWNPVLNPCGAFTWGEVEDYQLMVEPVAGLRSAENLPLLNHLKTSERSRPTQLKVWPIPAKDILNYAIALEHQGPVEAVLYDGLGRVMWRALQDGHVGLQQYQIPLGLLPPGIYQLQVRAGGHSMTRSVMVQQE
jgi:hypothetical protein